MLFYEPLFLFIFLPSFYLAYLLGERRAWTRRAVILLASLLFYLWAEPVFVPIVLASAALDHYLTRRIASQPGTRRARALLTVGVLSNLALLVHYKYTGFLVANLDGLLAGLHLGQVPVPAILLPIGVSFIVFEKITYLVDAARGLSRPAPDLPTYLLYVFFFPKLLAGPIIKYHEMEGQLRALPAANLDDFSAGFLRFMLGVVKKCLLANTLAGGADAIFGNESGRVGFHDAWWGVLLFTFQIYFDFSGYSDMAIGLARMLGFRLPENFNMPYLSCSITEFWRRWHISLATWIREYLYIPLGGNRVSAGRRLANLWVCFLASGLWHGAAWTFIAWGAYNGLFLVLDKLFLLRALDRLPRLAANAVTFVIVAVGWTVFRAHSFGQAADFLAAMARPGFAGTAAHVYVTPDLKLALAAAAAICATPRLPGFAWARDRLLRDPWPAVAWQTALALAFVVAVGKSLADPFQPFLYFRF